MRCNTPRSSDRRKLAARCAKYTGGSNLWLHQDQISDARTPRLGDIEGIYSDLLLHRMGDESAGGAGYRGNAEPRSDPSGPEPSEWRTPPLWGVADSAPYMHDGRADTLEEAIRLHGGQGKEAASQFARLSPPGQQQLVAFLKTLRAPGVAVAAPAAAIMRGLPSCP